MIEISNTPGLSITVPFEVCASCPLMTKVIDAATSIDDQNAKSIDINCVVRLNELKKYIAYLRGMGSYVNKETKVYSNIRTRDLSGTPPENCPPTQSDFVPEPVNISDITTWAKLDSGHEW